MKSSTRDITGAIKTRDQESRPTPTQQSKFHLSEETIEIGFAIRTMEDCGFGSSDIDEEIRRIRNMHRRTS